MLKIENLSVQISNKILLNDISLSFDSDKVVGVLGPNGAGKSTLLKSLAQLIDSKGKLEIDNKNFRDFDLRERSLCVSYCGSSDEILSEMSAADVLNYSRYGRDEDVALKDRIIDIFDLSELLERSVNVLSGGERQRLNLACSLYQDSKVILWDEPTNYLDPRHVDKLEEIIKNELSHKLMIVVSHDINFLLDISDRIVSLKNSSLFNNQRTAELFEEESLDNLFDKNFLYLKQDSKMVVR